MKNNQKTVSDVLLEDEGETLNVTRMVEKDLEGAINFLKMMRYEPNLFDILVSTVAARVERNIAKAHQEEKEKRKQGALDFNKHPE